MPTHQGVYIQQLQEAYWQTLHMLHQRNQDLTLRDLLDIDDRFDDFAPHPDRRKVEAQVKAFCQRYHIWHEHTGDVYNTMTGYLHPYTVNPGLLATIGKVYALLYFMDDYIGNEKQKHLSPEEQAQSQALLTRLGQYLAIPAYGHPTDPSVLADSPIENVTRILLEEIEAEARAKNTPERAAWFKRFAGHLLQHLNKAIVDQDQSDLLSVEEYILVRDEVSGMKPAVLLMEFGSRNYLSRPKLDKLDLLALIEEMELLCVRYGGLVNDLFSFYKEVMEDQTVFNLVSIIYLNQINPDQASETTPFIFLKAINQAGQLLAEIKERFFDLAGELWAEADDLAVNDPELAAGLHRHIQDLTDGVIATWRWQLEDGNPRYARQADSVLFTEIAQPADEAAEPYSPTIWRTASQF